MEKEAQIKKTQKNPSQPKPDELKPKPIKWKKKQPIKKTKKLHHSLNPKDLNQSQQNVRGSSKLKNKKNPSYPNLDGLKPKAIKWKKKAQIKKQKKSILA